MAGKEIRRVVDSMTPDEIVNVYQQEIPFINFKCFEGEKVFSKCLYANHTQPYFFKPVEYQRKNGMTVVLQFFDRSTNYPQKQRLGVWEYVRFNYRGGMTFLRPCNYPDIGMVYYLYTSHFVDRYRERLIKDVATPKAEAFNRFMCNNSKRVLKYVPSEKYPDNGWMLSPEGLCFVEVKYDSIVIAKTFIPWSYLTKEQIVTFNELGQEVLAKGAELNIPWEMFNDSDLTFG
jgi:hypothetical protein